MGFESQKSMDHGTARGLFTKVVTRIAFVSRRAWCHIIGEKNVSTRSPNPQLFDTSGNGTIDKNELEQFQMRTEDIEQFDEELWNIVKPGILGPLKP